MRIVGTLCAIAHKRTSLFHSGFNLYYIYYYIYDIIILLLLFYILSGLFSVFCFGESFSSLVFLASALLNSPIVVCL